MYFTNLLNPDYHVSSVDRMLNTLSKGDLEVMIPYMNLSIASPVLKCRDRAFFGKVKLRALKRIIQGNHTKAFYRGVKPARTNKVSNGFNFLWFHLDKGYNPYGTAHCYCCAVKDTRLNMMLTYTLGEGDSTTIKTRKQFSTELERLSTAFS